MDIAVSKIDWRFEQTAGDCFFKHSQTGTRFPKRAVSTSENSDFVKMERLND